MEPTALATSAPLLESVSLSVSPFTGVRCMPWAGDLVPQLESDRAIVVTTLQGRLVTRLDEALGRSSGMTLSHMDLVLSGFVRSVRQRKVIP